MSMRNVDEDLPATSKIRLQGSRGPEQRLLAEQPERAQARFSEGIGELAMVADSLAAVPLERHELSGGRMFQALGENAYELDREFRYLTYNEGCAAYYGTPREIALGRPIWDVFPEVRGGPLGQLLRAAMA